MIVMFGLLLAPASLTQALKKRLANNDGHNYYAKES